MTDSFDWTGRVGDVWAAEWRRTDRSFADLSRHLDAAILAAAPHTGRALDVGCGAGATSLTLAAARPGLSITGIDLSQNLIAVARDRAGNRPNLRFQVADAGDMAKTGDPAPFDLIFSRHGVMFFADPVAGFAALRAVAVPGARLVFSCFRAVEENPWAMELTSVLTGAPPVALRGYAPGPFALADRDASVRILAAAGWRDARATSVDFSYAAGEGPDAAGDAIDFFSRIGPAARILADAAHADRPALRDRLRDALERRRRGDTVTFPAAAWIWTATAGGEHP